MRHLVCVHFYMRCISFLVILFAAISCTKSNSTATVPPKDSTAVMPPAVVKTYLALGDSYTIGQSVTASERFPAQTVALLRQEGMAVADPIYIAQTGWTTGSLQTAIATQNPPSTFDIVSLLIGVNDQYQHMDTTGYTLRFTQLLEKSISLAGGNKSHVFVLSIPDYSVTPFVPASEKERVSREVDEFNSVNKRITTAYNISYTDITVSSREGATNSALIAGDGLHPSGLEYKKWAELLAPKIKAALQ